MSTSANTYHHGDLRAALVASAIELLESGAPYSLRAVARHAGVSAAAPYRHFSDREALDSAIAVEGFKDLHSALREVASSAAPAAGVDSVLGSLAVAYVAFSLRRPEVFRLMFGNGCDEENSDRVKAAKAVSDFLCLTLEQLLPGKASPELATALWGLAHGLAFLHLDGKFRPGPEDLVAQRVQDSVSAIIGNRNVDY